ncbi:MAG: alcohol dehydrogenase catalytic domain-containing protein [Rhizobiaceae bacterium]|nr:alcohol dehydrogenase catalytic domain-containing protein [Rhizobiaceae bacterium]
MKALVYTGTMQTEFRDESPPSPEKDEIIIDVSHCGICGSDMHAWHGHDARRVPPLILGHEAVGIARSGKHAGKRVALNPLMTCGKCEYCSKGSEHLCPERELIGMRVPGAFASSVAISEENLYPLPDHLAFDVAALAEPLAVCVHAVNLALKTGTPKHVLVIGGGAIGLLTAMVLKVRGVSQVTVAEMNSARAKTVEKVAEVPVINPAESSLPNVPVIIDCVGSGRTRAAISAAVEPGGTIVHVGLQDNEEGLDTRRLTLQEITFTGTYCYTNAEFQSALDLLAQGKINRDGWTEIRPLSEGGQGFEDIHNGIAMPKIILEM